MAKKNIMVAIRKMANNGKVRTKMTVNQCSIAALTLEGFDVRVVKSSEGAKGQGNRVEAVITWENATEGIALDCRRQAEKRAEVMGRDARDKRVRRKRRGPGLGRASASVMWEESSDGADEPEEAVV